MDPGPLQGVNGTNALTAQQTHIHVQSVNETIDLILKLTQVQGINGVKDVTPQQTQVQGVNGNMDLITSTGCKSDHEFHPTTEKSTRCKCDQ